MFSYGVILWELVFRKKPWEGTHSMKVIQLVGAGKRLNLNSPPSDTPTYISNFFPSLFSIIFIFFDLLYIIDLIKLCWSQEPAQRPSFPQILEQFFSIV